MYQINILHTLNLNNGNYISVKQKRSISLKIFPYPYVYESSSFSWWWHNILLYVDVSYFFGDQFPTDGYLNYFQDFATSKAMVNIFKYTSLHPSVCMSHKFLKGN